MTGGFGSYLVAMDERTYKLIGEDYPGNRAEDVINPSLWWMTGFLARKQVQCLGKYLSMSLIWSCFKWFFSGIGDSCGFDNFPSLELTLFKNTFMVKFGSFILL
ncbi:hypothetical protein RchiOBHm_Chr2g0155151 [Rosa chinensis]|uniref:Uncharacterized protein n=1 Tax=Rosa chinensis TaxID=74649 RepID=A0A2P6S164_ROSCH|nr:hypothetical protein RchiOBHm_Chr2g0155151 [Rosa chinensis]